MLLVLWHILPVAGHSCRQALVVQENTMLQTKGGMHKVSLARGDTGHITLDFQVSEFLPELPAPSRSAFAWNQPSHRISRFTQTESKQWGRVEIWQRPCTHHPKAVVGVWSLIAGKLETFCPRCASFFSAWGMSVAVCTDMQVETEGRWRNCCGYTAPKLVSMKLIL